MSQVTKFHPNGVADLTVTTKDDGSSVYEIDTRRQDLNLTIALDTKRQATSIKDGFGRDVEFRNLGDSIEIGRSWPDGSGNKTWKPETTLKFDSVGGSRDILKYSSDLVDPKIDFDLKNGNYEYQGRAFYNTNWAENEPVSTIYHVGKDGAFMSQVVDKQNNKGVGFHFNLYSEAKFIGNSRNIPAADFKAAPSMSLNGANQTRLPDGTYVIVGFENENKLKTTTVVSSNYEKFVSTAREQGKVWDLKQVVADDGKTLSKDPHAAIKIMNELGIPVKDGEQETISAAIQQKRDNPNLEKPSAVR